MPKKVNKKIDKKIFKKTANRTHKVNSVGAVHRGGIRF